MRKVAINSQFGGFGLSGEALKMLAEMDSPIVKWSDPEKYGFHDIDNFPSVDGLWWYRDNWVGKKITHSFTQAEQRDGIWFPIYILDGLLGYISSTHEPLFRTHPDLIKTLEALGDKANGMCAEIKIIEIPEDVEFEIDDYDGMESIHEKHRSWC